MNPTPDYPIERLSDAAWQRIEQNLFAELETRSQPLPVPSTARKWAALSLAACLPLAAAGILLLRREPAELEAEHFRSATQARELRVGDVSVRMDPGSELVAVRGDRRSLLLVLEHGAARFAVPPRQAHQALVVLAGDARIEVVGTQFRVARDDQSVQVETYEGTVRVRQAGHSTLVTRGQRWPERATAAASGASEASPAAAAAPPAVSPVRPPDAPDRQRRRFEQASARERTEPKQALQIYGALARESGPWAGNALYALGRLELDLQLYRESGRHLQQYLERYPQGANAVDARSLLARIASEHAANGAKP